MTGFKSGSAGDPFGGGDGNVESDEDDASDDEVEASVSIDTESSPDRDGRRDDRDDRAETTSTSASSSGLPWIYQRDSITDDRTTVQLHLQDESEDREREGKSDVEGILGESVKKADLREAALLVGLEHVDEVADQLEEWGYNFE
ncbi:hypothetical protein [Natrinema pallidum]|uniref:hypothetical protein n=1 Tax=Natrinema pallidum TaxID=69527 RepID=UPI00375170AD